MAPRQSGLGDSGRARVRFNFADIGRERTPGATAPPPPLAELGKRFTDATGNIFREVILPDGTIVDVPISHGMTERAIYQTAFEMADRGDVRPFPEADPVGRPRTFTDARRAADPAIQSDAEAARVKARTVRLRDTPGADLIPGKTADDAARLAEYGRAQRGPKLGGTVSDAPQSWADRVIEQSGKPVPDAPQPMPRPSAAPSPLAARAKDAASGAAMAGPGELDDPLTLADDGPTGSGGPRTPAREAQLAGRVYEGPGRPQTPAQRAHAIKKAQNADLEKTADWLERDALNREGATGIPEAGPKPVSSALAGEKPPYFAGSPPPYRPEGADPTKGGRAAAEAARKARLKGEPDLPTAEAEGSRAQARVAREVRGGPVEDTIDALYENRKVPGTLRSGMLATDELAGMGDDLANLFRQWVVDPNLDVGKIPAAQRAALTELQARTLSLVPANASLAEFTDAVNAVGSRTFGGASWNPVTPRFDTLTQDQVYELYRPRPEYNPAGPRSIRATAANVDDVAMLDRMAAQRTADAAAFGKPASFAEVLSGWDAGTPPAYAGTPPPYAGTPPPYVGTPPPYAGTPPPFNPATATPSPVAPAAAAAFDAGTPPFYAGTPPPYTPSFSPGTPPPYPGTPPPYVPGPPRAQLPPMPGFNPGGSAGTPPPPPQSGLASAAGAGAGGAGGAAGGGAAAAGAGGAGGAGLGASLPPLPGFNPTAASGTPPVPSAATLAQATGQKLSMGDRVMGLFGGKGAGLKGAGGGLLRNFGVPMAVGAAVSAGGHALGDRLLEGQRDTNEWDRTDWGQFASGVGDAAMPMAGLAPLAATALGAGPAGWAALGIGALGVGAYGLGKALLTDETPLDKRDALLRDPTLTADDRSYFEGAYDRAIAGGATDEQALSAVSQEMSAYFAAERERRRAEAEQARYQVTPSQLLTLQTLQMKDMNDLTDQQRLANAAYMQEAQRFAGMPGTNPTLASLALQNANMFNAHAANQAIAYRQAYQMAPMLDMFNAQLDQANRVNNSVASRTASAYAQQLAGLGGGQNGQTGQTDLTALLAQQQQAAPAYG